jgi:hypothetical protein
MTVGSAFKMKIPEIRRKQLGFHSLRRRFEANRRQKTKWRAIVVKIMNLIGKRITAKGEFTMQEAMMGSLSPVARMPPSSTRKP